MSRLTKISQLLALLVFVLVLAGCDLKDVSSKLRKLDDRIGQDLGELQKKQQEDVINLFDKAKVPAAKDLTKEQKEKIDNWLEANNLNRYGDSADAIYTGGTPLFNEATGESLDRFDYILKNHPNLLDE